MQGSRWVRNLYFATADFVILLKNWSPWLGFTIKKINFYETFIAPEVSFKNKNKSMIHLARLVKICYLYLLMKRQKTTLFIFWIDTNEEKYFQILLACHSSKSEYKESCSPLH